MGILRCSVGTIFFKWGLKFLKFFEKSGKFLQNVGIFLKNWRNFSKMLGFFSKIVGIFKKSGEIFAKCGDFWEETLVGTSGDFRQIWWGFSAGTFRQHWCLQTSWIQEKNVLFESWKPTMEFLYSSANSPRKKSEWFKSKQNSARLKTGGEFLLP